MKIGEKTQFISHFFLPSVELPFWSKVHSPLLMLWKTGAKGNGLVHLCNFISVDLAHHYQEYYISNVCSLTNKLDELLLLLGKNKDFSSSSVLFLTETCGLILESALQLAGFQLYREDYTKTKGGGICSYTNSGWCNYVTVIQQHCSSELESFLITVNLFTPPVSLFHSLCVKQTNLDPLVIALCDFKKGNHSHKHPKYSLLSG